jgi:hypothetical protein
MFIYSSCGKWIFPPACGVFLPAPLLQAFLLLIAGCVLLLLPAGMFVYSSNGRCVFLLSCGVFLLPPLSQALLLPVAGACPVPTLSSEVQLVYLQFWEGFPSTLFGAWGASPSLLCVFIVLIAYYYFLFFPVEGRSIQGAMLIWPSIVCGSTAYHLAHLVCIFPICLSAGIWQPRGPPGFFI